MDREKDSLLKKEAAIVLGADGFCIEEIWNGRSHVASLRHS